MAAICSPRELGLGCPTRAEVLQAEAPLEGTGPAQRKAREPLCRQRRAPGAGRTRHRHAALTALFPRKPPSKKMLF